MTYIGSNFPILQKDRLRMTRDGVIVEHRWKVLTSQVSAFVDNLIAQGYTDIAADADDNSPFHIVTFVATADAVTTETVLVDLWNVSFNEEQISIWAKPEVVTELRKASSDQAILWRADVESYFQGQRTYEDADGQTQTLSSSILIARAVAWGASSAVVTSLFRSLGDGVESFVESLPVLRRRITVPWNTSLNPTMSNIGAIYSTSALLAAQPTIPNNLANGLPTTGFWLKKAPTAEQLEDGRWAYTEEYWYVKQYDPFIYTTVFL